MATDQILHDAATTDIQRYYEKGLAETLARLEAVEHNRLARKAWDEEKRKIQRLLREDIPDDEYPGMLELMLKMAEAETWYAVKHPVLYVVPEQGVSQQTISDALKGIHHLRNYGVSWSTKIARKQEMVTYILDHADDGEGFEGHEKGDVALELIGDECTSPGYRPGILVLLNREIAAPNQPLGIVKPPFGAVVAKPGYIPLDIVVAHELVHYLWLDGRKPFDADMGHCFTEPCAMNMDNPATTLCGHHEITLQGYYAGIQEAVRR